MHNGEDYGKPQLHLQDSVFFDPRVDPFVMERVDWSESSHKDEKKEEIGQKAAGKTAESQRKKRQSGENKQIDASGLGQDSTISKPGTYSS